MDHADHVALIRRGVEGAGPRWLEVGAGEGAFTLALVDLLGPEGQVLALDRDGRALEHLAGVVRERFPAARLVTRVGDFTHDLPDGPLDGILAANSLHFVRDRRHLVTQLRERLGRDGRLLIVEYDADRGNPWVPHPFSFATWRSEAIRAGFWEPALVGRVPSRFLGAMYAAVTRPAARPER